MKDVAPIELIGSRVGIGLPEPFHVFAFQPGFDPKRAPLMIGAFAAAEGRPAEIAAKLRLAIADDLRSAHLFPSVLLTPADGTFVLTGQVVKAISTDTDAVTRVEARLTRANEVVGVMQVNVDQIQPSILSLAVTSLMSATSGSPAGNVSGHIRDMLEDAAAGRLEGSDVSTSTKRFVYQRPSRPGG